MLQNQFFRMADGKLVQPMGLVKDLKIKVYNFRYYPTILVMNFIHKLGYDLILRNPFLGESKLIHDRESIHVYIQNED